MNDKIKAALAQLDTANDNHWTADGLPRLETVRMIAGNQQISRDDITKVAPEFTRQSAAPAPAAAQSVAPAAVSTSGPETAAGSDPAGQQSVDLDAQILFETDKMNTIRTYLSQANAALVEQQGILDNLINKKHEFEKSDNPMSVIQCYLESQRKLLDDKAVRQQTIKNSGVTLEQIQSLLPQVSPLDAALSRKR